MIKQDNESSIMKKSILIVDDDPDIVNLTEKFLNLSKFKTITCINGKEALKIIEEKHEEIGLVLLDIMMPGKSGYDILREIKSNEKFKNILVILFTVKDFNEDIKKGRELGADGYLMRPFSGKKLLKFVQEQSKNVLNECQTILICDDESDVVYLAEKILILGGYNTVTCSNGKELLETMEIMHDKIDLILLDVRMPVLNGHDTLKELKTTNKYKDTPVVLFTICNNNEDVQKGRKLGADAFLPKPFSAKGLLKFIQVMLEIL
ncbi:MAG: response regulator [Promethearchaeota archaeon]